MVKKDDDPTKTEERNLPDLIKVFKANINSPRGQWPRNPDAFLTRDEMAYIVKILEQHQKNV